MSKDYRTIGQILGDDLKSLNEVRYTNIYNRIKGVKGLKRKDLHVISAIDPDILKKVVNSLDFLRDDVELEEGKLSDEMIRRHFSNVWALSKKEPKILDMFHKRVNTANFKKKQQAYRKMTVGVFVRDELGGGYLDPKIIKKLKLTGQQSSSYKDLYYEDTELEEASALDGINDIVKTKGAKKVNGVVVDMFTASMIKQVYDKVNDANKKKMEKANIQTLVQIAQKVMGMK